MRWTVAHMLFVQGTGELQDSGHYLALAPKGAPEPLQRMLAFALGSPADWPAGGVVPTSTATWSDVVSRDHHLPVTPAAVDVTSPPAGDIAPPAATVVARAGQSTIPLTSSKTGAPSTQSSSTASHASLLTVRYSLVSSDCGAPGARCWSSRCPRAASTLLSVQCAAEEEV